ncbi:MAG TPA: peptidase [Candidatus Thermoplasmatota archaeon]|jgi:hypothetical protein
MTQPTSTRRTFIKTTATSTAAAIGAPAILGAADKAGKRNAIVGSGAYKYEAIHDWGELPDHIVWGDTHGVCVDEAGLIYIKHRSSADVPMDAIAVFEPSGKFVRSFGKEYHRGGHGLDLRKEGGTEFLYLCDTHNRRVSKTDLKGDRVWDLSYPFEPGLYSKVKQFSPTNVAFAPDGGFYVGDGYGSHYIHQYDKNARWVRSWGGAGKEPGKMQTPHGLWVDDRPGREPSLVVADRANARLQYFTLDGKHLSFFDDMRFPAHFDIRGDVLLVPDLHARVSLLGKDNKVIAHLGHDEAWIKEVLDGFAVRKDRSRWRPGMWVHPHDACFDADGNIFVVEWVPTGRVTKLRHLA